MPSAKYKCSLPNPESRATRLPTPYEMEILGNPYQKTWHLVGVLHAFAKIKCKFQELEVDYEGTELFWGVKVWKKLTRSATRTACVKHWLFLMF